MVILIEFEMHPFTLNSKHFDDVIFVEELKKKLTELAKVYGI
jgi:hypothetical protein